jgi:hypothetical protein
MMDTTALVHESFLRAEIAGVLGVTERTVRRDWDKARTFLMVALQHCRLSQSFPGNNGSHRPSARSVRWALACPFR